MELKKGPPIPIPSKWEAETDILRTMTTTILTPEAIRMPQRYCTVLEPLANKREVLGGLPALVLRRTPCYGEHEIAKAPVVIRAAVVFVSLDCKIWMTGAQF